MLKKRIGKRIKAHRKAAGFETQKQLADALNTEQPTISRWESGQYVPSNDNLKALAKTFGVSPEDILSTKDISALANEKGDLIEEFDDLKSRLKALEEKQEQLPTNFSYDKQAEIEVLKAENKRLKKELHPPLDSSTVKTDRERELVALTEEIEELQNRLQAIANIPSDILERQSQIPHDSPEWKFIRHSLEIPEPKSEDDVG